MESTILKLIGAFIVFLGVYYKRDKLQFKDAVIIILLVSIGLGVITIAAKIDIP